MAGHIKSTTSLAFSRRKEHYVLLMTIPLLSKQILDKFPFENVCVRYVKTVLIDFFSSENKPAQGEDTFAEGFEPTPYCFTFSVLVRLRLVQDASHCSLHFIGCTVPRTAFGGRRCEKKTEMETSLRLQKPR